ncbi:MAG: M23 family metallopeptidase [Candidatus Colwellbacteria bacterium]|nr:M23 family metallopeptidase [Candidatus Colwellbacteria bacterium]
MRLIYSSYLLLFLISFPVVVYGQQIDPGTISGNFVLPARGGGFYISTAPGEGSHTGSLNQYAYDIAPVKGSGGTPIAVSVANGIVANTYLEREGGNCVIVDHGNGNFSQYCHLASFSVSKNKEVKLGDQIGVIGSTGISSGDHLHFSFVSGGSWPPAPNGAPMPGELSSLIVNAFQKGNPGGPGNGTISPNPVNPNDLKLGEIGKLVTQFYEYSLMIGGLLALAIIVYGGIMYIASPANESLKSDAKEWIKAAIFGLALLALAYLILNTINPCFVGGPTCPVPKPTA